MSQFLKPFLSFQDSKIEFRSAPSPDAEKTCPIQVQKETNDGMVDGRCDELAIGNYAGYCK